MSDREKLEAALHEADVYGIGATSNVNQALILQAARALTLNGPTEIDRLRALNAALVEALEDMLKPIGPDSVDDIERFMCDGDAITERAREVLTLAKGEKT